MMKTGFNSYKLSCLVPNTYCYPSFCTVIAYIVVIILKSKFISVVTEGLIFGWRSIVHLTNSQHTILCFVVAAPQHTNTSLHQYTRI